MLIGEITLGTGMGQADQHRVSRSGILLAPMSRATILHPKLLATTPDWHVLVDHSEALVFHPHSAITNIPPGIIIWSDLTKPVLLMAELAVSWEKEKREVLVCTRTQNNQVRHPPS